ncbi:hypothetical protein Tco_0240867 [Tanacetum coccineum]
MGCYNNALVAPENRRVIADVPVIYMHQFWATINKYTSSTYRFKIDRKRFSVNVEVFREILNICPKVLGKPFDEPPTEEEALSFIYELGHSGEVKYITDVSGLDKIRLSRVQVLWGMYYKKNLDFMALIWDDLAYQIDNMESKKHDNMFYPRFTKIIIHHFLTKDKSILMRNKMFMHTARDDSLLGTMRFVSRHVDTQVYGALLPKAMKNQALLDSEAYKTYYAIALGAKPPQSRKSKKKYGSTISFEETTPKKKYARVKRPAKKSATVSKKKEPFKADIGKGLEVPSEVALSETAQLKQSKVPDKHQQKASGIDEGTVTKLGVFDVPKYDSKSGKESWGNSDEEDDDDDEDDVDDDDSDDDEDIDEAEDDDNQEHAQDDQNDDEEETDSDRTESNNIKVPVFDQSTNEYQEEEEYVNERVHTPSYYEPSNDEKIDDEAKMNEEEDDEISKELYDDVNVNLGKEDIDITQADQGGAELHDFSQESGFLKEEDDLLNLDISPPRLDETSSQTSSLYTIPVTAIPKIMSTGTTTTPLPPSFFIPSPQQAKPTPTPTTSTTSFPKLRDFISVFKFNERVSSLEKDVSQLKQDDKSAQHLEQIKSQILAIVDEHLSTRIGYAVQTAVQSYTVEFEKEAKAEQDRFIDIINNLIKYVIQEEIKKQLLKILPDFVTPMIQSQVTESLENVVLAKSSSQPRSSYEAAESLIEFELKKILLNKMKQSKSYRHLKNIEISMIVLPNLTNPKSKESKSTSASKGSSHPQQKTSDKYAHVEDPCHIGDDASKQQDQDFVTGDIDEQLTNKEVSKADCEVAHVEEPRTSFDELMDTSFDFSTFILNRLKIKDPTQEILVGPAFELLKGTRKSLPELEYHLEECSKATTERLDWHNPEGKPYPFDLRKPLSLIQDHRGCQVIPVDYFINNDLEHLKGGSSSRRYSTSVTKTKAASYKGTKRQRFYVFASNMTSSKDVYSKKRNIAVTRLKIIKKYDYGHLEEIEVRREDQKLYSFRDGDFPRLCLQDIEDMLLLLVQQKLTNLTIDERYDLNVALSMFTRRIVIQRRSEALQLFTMTNGNPSRVNIKQLCGYELTTDEEF